MAIETFKRYEKKYFITNDQRKELIERIKDKMGLDNFCLNNQPYLVRNIYYDNDNDCLVSKSIQKPDFKEKFRIRKYGFVNDNKDEYYCEVKRKVNGIVYKRRVRFNEKDLNDFVLNNKIPNNLKSREIQISKELSYMINLYKLKPKVFLSYERLGFFDKENPNFRLTIDQNIYARECNFDFDNTNKDILLLDENHYILEVKVENAMPLWFCKILSDLKIYSSSFSKYGREYELRLKGE